MTLAARLFRSTPPAEARALGRWNVPESFFAAPTASGQSVNADSAMRLVAVYSCVRLLSESVATLPVDTVRTAGDARIPGPTPRWLLTPNPEQTGQELLEQTMAALNLLGNAYLYVVRGARGDVLELWPLHPDTVRVERLTPGGPAVYTATATGHTFSPVQSAWTGDLLHLRALSIPGALLGMSPIERARESIGLGLAAQDYGARWFSQGSAPAGVIEVDGPLPDSATKAIARQWRDEHVGSVNAHLPGVLTHGAKYKPITLPPEQAQFLETRQFQLGEIARLFRIPPHMLGAPSGESMTYANVEQWGIEYATYGLRPWLVRLEAALSRLLPNGSVVRFRAEGLLRGDSKARADFYAAGLRDGWLVPNEPRRWEDLAPLPGGDEPRPAPATSPPVKDPAPNA